MKLRTNKSLNRSFGGDMFVTTIIMFFRVRAFLTIIFLPFVHNDFSREKAGIHRGKDTK